MRTQFERAIDGLPPEVKRMYATTAAKLQGEATARSRVAALLGVPERVLESVTGAAGMMITIALEMRADGLADDAKATLIVANAVAIAHGELP